MGSIWANEEWKWWSVIHASATRGDTKNDHLPVLQTFPGFNDEATDWFSALKEYASFGSIPRIISKQASATNEQSAWLRSGEFASWSSKSVRKRFSFWKCERASEAIWNLDDKIEEGPPFQHPISRSKEAILAFTDVWSSSNFKKGDCSVGNQQSLFIRRKKIYLPGIYVVEAPNLSWLNETEALARATLFDDCASSA